MKHLLQSVLAASLVSILASSAVAASATITPSLQLSATGSGDNVQVTVVGDPNESVLLSYTKAGYGPTIVSIGNTDGSGELITTISSASYGLTSGTPVVAIVGGASGPQSASVAWPTVTPASSLTLSQNAVIVNAGSSASLTATNSISGSLYVSNNSNPSIANVSISGDQVTISGNTPGVTTVTLCAVGSSLGCPSLYVTVLQSGTAQLSLSQTNPTVVPGQNLPITISGGNGNYLIENNSSPSTIQASISGSVLTLSTGSTSGSATITVCSTDLATCGTVTAAAGDASSVAVSLSTTAPSVAVNQSVTVGVYGPSGVSYYVSNNSNPSSVQANLSGTTLTLTGIAQGSSNITVCASTNSCATLTATITPSVSNGNIAVSQNTLSLTAGQSATITVSGGTQPYSLSGGTNSVTTESISGTTLTIYGVAAGVSTVWACENTGGGCAGVAVTVTGSGTTAAFSMSQTNLSLSPGGSAVVSLYGNGSYYLAGNASPSIATVSVSGSTAVVAGLSAGTTNATICESGGSCSTLTVTVNAALSPSVPVSTPAPAATAPVFTEYLAPGARGSQVTALQQLLLSEGYSIPAGATGYYGSQTVNAVVDFQKAHGIDQLGVVGPATRAALNGIENPTSSGTTALSSADISTMTLSELQSEAQTLEAQLTQVLSRITQLTAGQ